MKSIRGFFQAMFCICALTVPGQGASAQQTTPAFALTLSGGTRNRASTDFRVGSTIWITIVQTNKGSNSIDCTEIAQNGINTSYHYEVTDEDGKPLERVTRPHMDTEPKDVHPCNLAAGKSVTGEEELNDIFNLDRPGKYTVQVWRWDPDTKDSQGNPVKVYSNTITITITG